MVFLAALLIPLLSLWLWYPLLALGYPTFWCTVVITAVLGLLPVVLIWAMRSDRLSYWLIAHLQVISGTLFAAIGIALVFALLRDLGWLVLRLFQGAQAAQLLTQPAVSLGGFALALLISIYGTSQGLKVPEVREQEVLLPGLPAELDGLRVAVLADIHATPVNNAAYVQALVERTNAALPDLVVLPGDMVDGDSRTQAGNLAPLADLRATYGVWSAPGNHEYYSGYDAWARVYADLNLNYLQNQSQILEIRGRRLAISGVGDPAYGRLSQQNTDPEVAEGLPPDIATVAAQARAGGAQFHILLGHQPKLARDYAQHGVDLQIAGHTHGGHIRGLDQWVMAPANAGFVRGLYQVGGMRLFVSSGAGLWAGFAVRLGVPSAIDLLVLRRSPD